MTTTKGKKIDNALVIAKYYGFEDVKISNINRDHHDKAKKQKNKEDFKHPFLPNLEEYVSVLTYAHKDENRSLPILLYTKGEVKTTKRKKTPANNIGLHIIGTKKSIAEAILIKTAFAILKEEGYKSIKLLINSLGDRESQQNFNKSLTAFFRTKLSELNAQAKHALKFGGHTLLSSRIKGISKVVDDAPSSIEFLSEDSKKHFKEVIEYLESQEIPFEIDKKVVGDPHYSTNTVFKIIDQKTEKVLAAGTRYDDLAKKTISRKAHPAVSININLPKLKKVSATKIPCFDKCDVYFIQLGYAAKLKSLEVLEMLRKANISVHQSIGRDKMSTQTEFANKKHVRNILLMGQKEALENSICVRDLETNSQTTIPLDKLVDTLKNQKKVKKSKK